MNFTSHEPLLMTSHHVLAIETTAGYQQDAEEVFRKRKERKNASAYAQIGYVRERFLLLEDPRWQAHRCASPVLVELPCRHGAGCVEMQRAPQA